jgi:carbon starvation protein CstA
MGQRVAAAALAVVLALAVPVLIVVASVVNDHWRPLVRDLLTIAIVVPLAVWFLGLSRRRRAAAEADQPPKP